MTERTAIEWCDSTFNPWIGCTKISPACDHCYAEAQMDTRMGRVEWGAGKPRSRTSEAYWRQPVRWNSQPFFECAACGWRGDANASPGRQPITKDGWRMDTRVCPSCAGWKLKPARRRVFCASLADVFDNEVDLQWRADLFALIRATPNLDWLLLTKRVGNARDMIVHATMKLDAPYWDDEPWPNVWLGATICNQTEADRDIPKLLAVPAAKRFLSIEPMLEEIEVSFALPWRIAGPILNRSLDWIICGGESGPHARPMHPDWVRSLRDQCAAAGVPFLFKQWGEWRPPADGEDFNTAYGMSGKPPAHLVSPDGKVHCFYPHGDTAVRPQDSVHKAMVRVGKRAAGRQLDGREHSEWPA